MPHPPRCPYRFSLLQRRTFPVRTFLLLLLLAGGGPACAGAAQGLGEGGPEPGRPHFVAHLTPDLEAGTLAATWEIAFVADGERSGGLQFGLAPGLRVSTVEGPAVLSFEGGPDPEPGGGLPVRVHTVALDGVTPGDTVRLVVSYAGVPLAGPDGITNLSPEWVELALDAFWFPLFLTFDQALQGRLHLTLPPTWTVASGGGSSFREGVHEVAFPAPGGLDVAFSAAPALTAVQGDGYLLLHAGEREERIQEVERSARRCAGWLNARFGDIDPLRDLRIVLAPRRGAAYQRPNYILLPRDVEPSAHGYDELLCHEMAHHWASRANFTSPDHWMNEGLAEFAMALAIRDFHGEEAYEGLVRRFEAGGREAGPVWTPEAVGRPDHATMYRRAPWLLARLETRMGEASFARFLARTLTEGIETTPALLRLLEEVAGPDVARAFRVELASLGADPGEGEEGAEGQGLPPGGAAPP